MRHLIGFILALIASAVLFMGGGWGLAQLSALSAHGSGLTSTTGVLALAAVVGTGLLLGILLVVPAVSPLATGLPGLALLGWTAVRALSVQRAVGWFPHAMAGWSPWIGTKTMLGDGMLALLGIGMVIPLFVPSRWRAAGAGESEGEEDDVLPAPTGLLS